MELSSDFGPEVRAVVGHWAVVGMFGGCLGMPVGLEDAEGPGRSQVG